MTLPIIIRPEAERDLVEATDWYDSERMGLGSEFLLAVGHLLQHLGDHPLMFPATLRRVRRALLPRFPYGLFYVPETDRVVVLACVHAMRDPKWIRSVIKARR